MAKLITGGSGFIGSHFHKVLDTEDLVNLDLNEPSFSHRSLFIKGDIRVEEDMRRAVQGRGIKTIISLAAKHHDFGIGHDEYFDTNEEGTRVICKLLPNIRLTKLFFIPPSRFMGSERRSVVKILCLNRILHMVLPNWRVKKYWKNGPRKIL